MTDPFDPSTLPTPEYEPGQGDPGRFDPEGPEFPDTTPVEEPQDPDASGAVLRS